MLQNSNNKNETTFLNRVFNFIKAIPNAVNKRFTQALNWFRSFFKKPEATSTQANSAPTQIASPAPEKIEVPEARTKIEVEVPKVLEPKEEPKSEQPKEAPEVFHRPTFVPALTMSVAKYIDIKPQVEQKPEPESEEKPVIKTEPELTPMQRFVASELNILGKKMQEEGAIKAKEQKQIRDEEFRIAQAERDKEAAAYKIKESKKQTTFALVKAIKANQFSLVEELLKKAEPDIFTQQPSQLLHAALKSANLDIIRLLMQYGVSLHWECTKDNYDYTRGFRINPWSVALESHNLDVVNLLLDNKVSFEEVFLRELGEPRRDAFENKEAKAIYKILLDNTSLVFYSSDRADASSYFMKAISIGHIESIKRTLAHLELNKNNPFIQDFRFAITSEHIKQAIKYNHLEMAKFLLTYSRAQYKKEYCASMEQSIFFNLVDSQSVDEKSKSINIEIMKFLLTDPVIDINKEDSRANYKKDSPELHINEEESRKNYEKHSALYYAVINQNSEMVQLLLEAGADFGTKRYSKEEINKIKDAKSKLTLPISNRLASLDKILIPPLLSIISEYANPEPLPVPEKPKSRRPRT